MTNNESGLAFNVSGKDIRVNRPEPIIGDIDVLPFNRRMDAQIAINTLIEGNHVLIVDFYSSGLTLLNELKRIIQNKYPDQSFQGQRDFRSAYHELSSRLLLEVRSNKLVVKKAPDIGWFKILYPQSDNFLLSFPQIQGLNSSWQWYAKGISIPDLGKKIHPFYGTYFPTRFEHLKLFDSWLKQYKGEKKSAYDIGIGCGVLSFKMLKHGFEKVCGTDTNPNAIIGLNEEINKTKKYSNIELLHGDLFAENDSKTELIVFNPPWLPAAQNIEGLDKAIYYDADLFPSFFAEAKTHLKDDGRVVLLFSNLAQITKVSERHPIVEELSSGGRFQKELFLQEKVSSASKKTKRNQNWRDTEMVEFWVLKLI